MVDRYMASGRKVAGALVVLDIRRTPGEAEAGLYEWLGSLCVPVVTVLTKSDKLSQSRRAARLREIKARLEEADMVVFSARTGLGKAALWKLIQELIESDDMEEGEDE